MIELTERALAHVHGLISDNDLAGYGLRVGVSPGGCSGFSYILDLVEEADEGDEIFEQDGIPIFCDTKSLQLIEGLRVDYESSMMGGGFKFENPNAKRACGCGTSFAC